MPTSPGYHLEKYMTDGFPLPNHKPTPPLYVNSSPKRSPRGKSPATATPTVKMSPKAAKVSTVERLYRTIQDFQERNKSYEPPNIYSMPLT